MVKKGRKKIDLIGQIYGRLKVIERINLATGHVGWKCLCECGKEKHVSTSDLKTKNTQSCGCLFKDNLIKRNSIGKWQGIGEIGKTVFNCIYHKAKLRNIKFDITLDYLWKIFLEQNKKCPLTGLILNFGRLVERKTWTASLDRIDSNKGYIEGNVRWVHKIINIMRRNMTDEEFISWCKLVAEHNST